MTLLHRIVAIAAISLASTLHASEVVLEQVAWPAPTDCRNCITLQFGVFELQLPHHLIGRIFVPTHRSFPVHILPKGAADARTSIVLLGTTEGSYMEKYARTGLSTAKMSAASFFDTLGHPATSGTPEAQVRKMEGIAAATRYTKATKGTVHAYWVRGPSGSSQYLHVVAGESRDVHSFVGGVTPELYDAILSNLAMKREP